MSDRPVLVIGLGNPIMADDGLGLAALARLRDGWVWPVGVELVDGGTWGMNLLPLIEGADRILFLDAVDADQAPGTPVRFERDDLPRYIELHLSPHQVDLREVLALAEFRGALPAEIVILGAQPEVVEMRAGLSPTLESCVEGLVGRARAQLGAWGIHGAEVEGAAVA
jgi:hydrogenase maturation protease